MLTAQSSRLLRFLAGVAPRANAPRDPWDLIGRALAGADRPRRPELAQARAVVARARREPAWGALVEAGLVPSAWASDPSRGFIPSVGFVAGVLGEGDGDERTVVDARSRARPVRRLDVSPDVEVGDLVIDHRGRFERAALDWPRDDELAVALAADVAGAARAEEFAREAASRLVFWGADPVTRVAWQLLRPGQNFAPTALDGVLVGVTENLMAEQPLDSEHDAAAFRRAAAAAGWGRAVRPLYALAMSLLRWDAMVAGDRYTLRGGCTFYRDLANPFDPLLELAALGYSAGSPEGNAVRIFVPPLGDAVGA